MAYKYYIQILAISAKLLGLNLKNKLEETGKKGKKMEETGRIKKKRRKGKKNSWTQEET